MKKLFSLGVATSLVPKKVCSQRLVIDFWKVCGLTVPDYYTLPLLSDLLQSTGKHNTVSTSLDLYCRASAIFH